VRKQLILVIIDALTARVVCPAIERGELPTLAALARAGAISDSCVSMFPSITPAATATLITGHYPNGHGIAGAAWYDEQDDQMIYYSNDLWTILREGPTQFFEEFAAALNGVRLEAPTLFTLAERAGLRAASLNNLIHHGEVPHELKLPWWLRIIPGVPGPKTVLGPSALLFGDLVAEGFDAGGEPPREATGVAHRAGFADARSAELLLHLARTGTVPDLTVAYFPDTDFHSHKVGPVEALETVRQVDAYLGELVAALGGLDAMLARFCVLVTGDHSHCDILPGDEAGITLDELLPAHCVAASGASWGDDDDLLIALNLRAAQIYLRRAVADEGERIAAALLADPRVDQVLWRWKDLNDPRPGYCVWTADRGRLEFWPGAGGPQTAPDQYGQLWCWQGELAAVDGQLDAEGRLVFPSYPNAFERLAAGLEHEAAGPLWVTARPGYSLHLTSTTGHEIHAGGGSHGALHAADSLVPLLLAGAPAGVTLPAHPRTVDVAALCLAVLGLPPEPPAGASRIGVT
jgi:hypothetical protein